MSYNRTIEFIFPHFVKDRVKGMSRPTKFDKVVKREICAITTKATRRFGYMDKEASDDKAAYLLAVRNIEWRRADEVGYLGKWIRTITFKAIRRFGHIEIEGSDYKASFGGERVDDFRKGKMYWV